jgi:hypothetical protein
VAFGYEVWWILAFVGGDSFFVFRVVYRGGLQVVMAASRAIRSSRLQPHLDSNVERLVGVVWSSRISSGSRDLRIIMELHWQFFLSLRLRDRYGLLNVNVWV